MKVVSLHSLFGFYFIVFVCLQKQKTFFYFNLGLTRMTGNTVLLKISASSENMFSELIL